MKTAKFETQTGNLFAILGNPFRIRLVLALWDQEACVCHLEALLQKRQAYISQHLMALREANLLDTRREGKFIYYRLSNPDVIELIRAAGKIAGVGHEPFPDVKEIEALKSCICPGCEGENSELAAVPTNKNLSK
jgi:ArsR family transcriptional regulator